MPVSRKAHRRNVRVPAKVVESVATVAKDLGVNRGRILGIALCRLHSLPDEKAVKAKTDYLATGVDDGDVTYSAKVPKKVTDLLSGLEEKLGVTRGVCYRVALHHLLEGIDSKERLQAADAYTKFIA